MTDYPKDGDFVRQWFEQLGLVRVAKDRLNELSQLVGQWWGVGKYLLEGTAPPRVLEIGKHADGTYKVSYSDLQII